MSTVLILGAGISGLIAARELAQRGHEVRVIEKSKGVGGRMATRRIGEATFDHGAQFFTTRGYDFKIEVANWEMKGLARRWFDGYLCPRGDQAHDVYTRFCGERGMTTIAKHLAQNVDIVLGEEIETLSKTDEGWTARSKSGQEYSAQKLLLTAPVPQSLKLFATSGQKLPKEACEVLESVDYEPCFAVMALLKNPSKIPPPGAIYWNEEPISFLADNFQKGVSQTPGAVTIHSTAKFAQAHYDDDQSEVGKHLINAACKCLGEVETFQVRRWRYSKASCQVHVGALHIPELDICFAGDGLNGAKVEGAFGSGLKAACLLSP